MREGGRVGFASFYSARLLRIVPLYYSAVLVAWLVSPSSSALKALLFIPVGFDIFPFSVPWWSLCTEMQFYVLLPWLMLGLQYCSGRYLLAAAAMVWLALHCHYFFQPSWLASKKTLWLQSSLFGRGLAFVVGALCCCFYMGRGFAWLRTSAKSLALLSVLLITGRGFCSGMAKSDRPRRLCACRFTTILKPCCGEAFSPWSAEILAAIAGSFMVSWLLAVICYHVIERPFLRLKSHLPVLTDRLLGRPARA